MDTLTGSEVKEKMSNDFPWSRMLASCFNLQQYQDEEGISLRSFPKTFIKVIFCLSNWILFFVYGFLPEAINVWDT